MSWIKEYIRDVENFPEKGVVFKDITPLLSSTKFARAIGEMADVCGVNWEKVDAIAGIESRGFIFAAAMAVQLGKGIVLIRKKGKLPPPFLAKLSTNEYAREILEIRPLTKKQNIVILDDVLATGGTLQTAYELCAEAGYNVKAISVLLDLTYLHKANLEVCGLPIKSVVKY